MIIITRNINDNGDCKVRKQIYIVNLKASIVNDIMDIDYILDLKEKPPSVARTVMRNIRQYVDETIEEFADRILQIAAIGYKNMSDQLLQLQSIDAFVKGCTPRCTLYYFRLYPDNLAEVVSDVLREREKSTALINEIGAEISEEVIRCFLHEIIQTGVNEIKTSNVKSTKAKANHKNKKLKVVYRRLTKVHNRNKTVIRMRYTTTKQKSKLKPKMKQKSKTKSKTKQRLTKNKQLNIQGSRDF